MKKLIKLEFDNTTKERKTENSYSELYSHDKNNGSFEFEILNDTLTTEQVIALFKFTESNKIWKTTGTVEGNKVKVTFDTTLITQNETVICYLYFDEEQRTSDTFRFKFKVKVSEIDKMSRYEVKERFINNTVIVDRLDVVTKTELQEALKNVGGIATEGLLTEVKAEELYAKKTDAVDNTNFELVKNRVLALELKTDKDTVYNDSELRNRVEVLENKPPVDLSNYATKEELRNVSGSQPLADNLVTKEELENKHYISDVSNLATKDELQEVRNSQPTVDTSHLVTRDELESKGYLTTHQDLSEYAKKSELYNDIDLKARVEVLEQKTDKDTVYDDTPLKERVTALESKAIAGGTYDDSDLRNRVVALETKEDKDTKYDDTEVKNRLTELENKPAVDTSVFVTEDKLNSKGYLTQHQELTHLATTSDLEVLRNIAVSKSELNDKLDTTEFNTFKDNVVTKTELAEKGYISDLSNYVTKEELHEATEIDYSNIVTTDELEPYAKKSELPQPYNDSALVSRVSALESKQDKDTVYNDTEVKQRLTALENRPSTGGGAQTQDTGWITISENNPLNGNVVKIRRINDVVHVSLSNPDTGNAHLQLEATDGHGAVLAEKEIQKGFTPMRTVIVPVISNIETIMLSTDLSTTGQAVFEVENNRVTLKVYDKDITSGIPTNKYINDFSYFTEDPFPTNLH